MRKHECGSHYNEYDAHLLKTRASFEFVLLYFFLAALALPEIARATPQIIRVDGSIFDNAGVPVTASKDIEIKAYDAASGGTLLWTSSVYNTAVSTGKFTINLDAAAGSTPSLVDRFGERTASQAIYFQIEVDSGAANGSMDTPTIVMPRIRAKGTAFALTAASADALKGVTATAAELNYLAGATGNVQTQINAVSGTAAGVSAKVSKAGDSMSGALQVGANVTSTGTVQAATLNSTAATASRFALFDSSKNLTSSATSVTDTEFGFLSGITANLATNLNGLTANVQTQINGKQATLAYVPVSKLGDSMSGALEVGANITSTGTLAAATVNVSGLTASRVALTDGSKNLVSAAVTDTELGYLAGVTASVQTQLNSFSGGGGGRVYQTTAGSCASGFTSVDTKSLYMCIEGSAYQTATTYAGDQSCSASSSGTAGTALTSGFWSAQLATATLRTCAASSGSGCYQTTSGACEGTYTEVNTYTSYKCVTGSVSHEDARPTESPMACPTGSPTTIAGSPLLSSFWASQVGSVTVRVCCK